jgi:putative transposase
VQFIREHADRRQDAADGGLRWGVEPICAVLAEYFGEHGLKIAPSTYYEHLRRDATVREQREEFLKVEIARVHRENFGVYGARKVWLQLNREGIAVARCTVERLMRELGLTGAVRGKVKKTTIADPEDRRAEDLVGRQFARLAPDRLWVMDMTYVSTWSGWVYVAFVTDAYARRILGWRCGTSMTTQLVLDALEQAIWTRQRTGTHDDATLQSVVAHSDRGSQGGFKGWSQHLDHGGVDGQACWVDEGIDWPGADEVAGKAVPAPGRGAFVLA